MLIEETGSAKRVFRECRERRQKLKREETGGVAEGADAGADRRQEVQKVDTESAESAARECRERRQKVKREETGGVAEGGDR